MKPTAPQSSAKSSPRPRPRRRSDATSPAAEAKPSTPMPAYEQRVREAAYFIYERSGRVAGRELDNWLEAEALLLREEAQAAQRDDASAG